MIEGDGHVNERTYRVEYVIEGDGHVDFDRRRVVPYGPGRPVVPPQDHLLHLVFIGAVDLGPLGHLARCDDITCKYTINANMRIWARCGFRDMI